MNQIVLKVFHKKSDSGGTKIWAYAEGPSHDNKVYFGKIGSVQARTISEKVIPASMKKRKEGYVSIGQDITIEYSDDLLKSSEHQLIDFALRKLNKGISKRNEVFYLETAQINSFTGCEATMHMGTKPSFIQKDPIDVAPQVKPPVFNPVKKTAWSF